MESYGNVEVFLLKKKQNRTEPILIERERIRVMFRVMFRVNRKVPIFLIFFRQNDSKKVLIFRIVSDSRSSRNSSSETTNKLDSMHFF